MSQHVIESLNSFIHLRREDSIKYFGITKFVFANFISALKLGLTEIDGVELEIYFNFKNKAILKNYREKNLFKIHFSGK